MLSSSSSSTLSAALSANNMHVHLRASGQAHAAIPEAAVPSWGDGNRWVQQVETQQQQGQQLPEQHSHNHSTSNYASLLSNGNNYRSTQHPMASLLPSSSRVRGSWRELSGDPCQIFVWTRISASTAPFLGNNAFSNQPPPRSGAARYAPA